MCIVIPVQSYKIELEFFSLDHSGLTIYIRKSGEEEKIEVQRVLQEEIREKKRTASGVHYKTGKRGYVGKMLFPTDMLKGKEKRSHQKASKVEISNMYETMMSRIEFEALPVEQQKQMLQGYRMHFHLKDIVKYWKMSTTKLYTLIKELELPALPKENVVEK